MMQSVPGNNNPTHTYKMLLIIANIMFRKMKNCDLQNYLPIKKPNGEAKKGKSKHLC